MHVQWDIIYLIVMRNITLHTIHVGAPENYTKSNNIIKFLTELKQVTEVIEKTNVAITFTNISISESTYYLLYDKSHYKTHSTIIPFSILLQILASPAKK